MVGRADKSLQLWTFALNSCCFWWASGTRGSRERKKLQQDNENGKVQPDIYSQVGVWAAQGITGNLIKGSGGKPGKTDHLRHVLDWWLQKVAYADKCRRGSKGRDREAFWHKNCCARHHCLLHRIPEVWQYCWKQRGSLDMILPTFMLHLTHCLNTADTTFVLP